MLKEETKIVDISGTTYLRIPKQVFKDSQFPFNEDDELEIEIINNSILITKKEGNKDEQKHQED